jgi:hypothetical protein
VTFANTERAPHHSFRERPPEELMQSREHTDGIGFSERFCRGLGGSASKTPRGPSRKQHSR